MAALSADLLSFIRRANAEAGVKPTHVEEPTSVLEAGIKDKERGTSDGFLPPPPSNVTVKTLFSHPDTHPVVLDMAAITKYGVDWLDWEPESIQLNLQNDFGNVSDLNFSKLMSMKTLHLVDTFWRQWEVFVWCAMPLNSLFPDFEIMQVPTVAQCAVAVDIANRIRTDVSWTDEMKAYLETVFLHDGLFMTDRPLDFLTIFLPEEYNLSEMQRRWADVKYSGQPPTGRTPEDEQLRRMLSVHEFLEDSKHRLSSQLSIIHDL